MRGLISELGRSLREGNGNPPSVLAWRISRTENPSRLQPIGSHRVGHDWSNLAHVHAHMKKLWREEILKRKKKLRKKRLHDSHEEETEAKGICLECKLVWVICLEIFGGEVTCKVSATAKLFNNKSTAFLLCCTIYSTIRRLSFYTTLTGKARYGQAEIN